MISKTCRLAGLFFSWKNEGNQYFCAPQFQRDVAQLVEYTSGGRVVAGSSPVIPTTKNPKRKLWVLFYYFFHLLEWIYPYFNC